MQDVNNKQIISFKTRTVTIFWINKMQLILNQAAVAVVTQNQAAVVVIAMKITTVAMAVQYSVIPTIKEEQQAHTPQCPVSNGLVQSQEPPRIMKLLAVAMQGLLLLSLRI